MCGESNQALNLNNSKQLPLSTQSQELYKNRRFEASREDNKKSIEVATQTKRRKGSFEKKYYCGLFRIESKKENLLK